MDSVMKNTKQTTAMTQEQSKATQSITEMIDQLQLVGAEMHTMSTAE
jgi:hypothetical protein